VIPERISHYTILRKLGEGGMGEVYLAQDTRLDRKVALKLLPAAFTADRDRLRRFEKEAKTASALNHPNIITIHETGSADDIHFIVTEFVEGLTLRQHTSGETVQLTVLLDYAIQVTSALAAAHEAGVVHRDVKPENVMVRRDGLIKVLDFGLAKLTEQQQLSVDSKSPTIARVDTEPGTLMGTTRYMSPEQARGLAVDARTDVFSLGVVLYEMVARRAPFDGETVSDIIASILKSEPVSLAEHSPDCPVELQRIITKALEKDRNNRYQTARDLLVDLKNLREELEFEVRLSRKPSLESEGESASDPRRGQELVNTAAPSPGNGLSWIRRYWTRAGLVMAAAAIAIASISFFGGTRQQTIDSIAVLPFVNAGADPNAEYLSDGITESIINSLAQLPNLKVMSRNSVFRFKGRESDVEGAARELRVSAVLTGRVVQRAGTLQVSAELVDARDNRHLWGDQYSRALADILLVQDEIANHISQKLRLKLTGEDERRLTKRYTNSADAYDLYLKGRYHYLKFDSEEIQRGIEYLSQAVALDPNYALAHAALAEAYFTNTNFPSEPREPAEMSRAAAKRALEIDDSLAEAYVPLALVKAYYDWDWAGAEKDFRRAIDLSVGNAWIRDWFGWFLLSRGRHTEGLTQARRAVELDPLAAPIVWDLGLHLYVVGQYDAAIEQFDRAISLDPALSSPYLFKGQVYQQKGQLELAINEARRAHQLDPNSWSYATLGHAYGQAGKRAEAEKLLSELRDLSASRFISPFVFATIYEGLGEKERAFQSLQKAYEARDPQLACWFLIDPRLESLRSDPRGKELLQRMGLAP
jgi:serine/threonine protein kinase/Tfp pilus assembly protein PilF